MARSNAVIAALAILIFVGGVIVGRVVDPVSVFGDDGQGGVEAVEAGFSFWANSQPWGDNVRSLACIDETGNERTFTCAVTYYGETHPFDVSCDDDRCYTNLDGDPVFFPRTTEVVTTG